MGTYVADKYIKGLMNSYDCSAEEAFAMLNSNPKKQFEATILDDEYISKAIDMYFKNNRELFKSRNLRFYKLLGQNHMTIVNAVLRGKDIYYEIPKRYELNTNHPFILDWLLSYGRPSQLTMVRTLGPVRLNCIYNALNSWISQNPNEVKKWLYQKEWDEYFDTAEQKTETKTTLHYESTNNKEETTMELKEMLPELEFKSKMRGGQGGHKKGHMDVYVSVVDGAHKNNGNKGKRLNVIFRNNCDVAFNSDYLAFAVFKNRLYFKPEDKNIGFKITTKKGKNSVSRVLAAVLSDEELSKYEPFNRCESMLMFDDAYELYYIEINEAE